MDEERREALKARRAALRDRLALAPINELVEKLAARGCRADVLFPGKCQAILGELIDVPCEDERIDWDRVPTGNVRIWSSGALRDALALKAVGACAAPDERVAAIWNPAGAGLAMTRADLEAGIALLLDEAAETWIVSAAGGKWLVECAIFDHEICWSADLMRGIGQKAG
ncbi:MAG TPA: hypothetical protein VK472_08255 [Allosphingosinicella sp.]|nr:hypothetical protein [Allosphingosinicella sp.]